MVMRRGRVHADDKPIERPLSLSGRPVKMFLLVTRISTLRAADSTPSALRSAAVCDRTERLCNHPVHDGLAMLPMVTKLKIGREMSVLCEYATAAYFSKVHMSHIFFPHKLAFSAAILILFVFLLPISIRFRYLDCLWLPTEWHHPCVWTPVERYGVVGFKQFCTIFPPHIWCLRGPQIFLKRRKKLTCLDYNRALLASVNHRRRID